MQYQLQRKITLDLNHTDAKVDDEFSLQSSKVK